MADEGVWGEGPWAEEPDPLAAAAQPPHAPELRDHDGADEDPTDGAHPSLEIVAPDAAAVERVWRTYWGPMLKGGGLERLKGELYDAWYLVGEAREVYRHVTGGLTDDLCASAAGIIAMAERRVEQRLALGIEAQQREWGRREEELLRRIMELERGTTPNNGGPDGR